MKLTRISILTSNVVIKYYQRNYSFKFYHLHVSNIFKCHDLNAEIALGINPLKK